MQSICSVLAAAGMVPCTPALTLPSTPQHMPVMLNGGVVGTVRVTAAATVVLALRRFKVRGGVLAVKYVRSSHIYASQASLPPATCRGCLQAQAGPFDFARYLEIAHIPFSEAGAYPGLYLFSSPARFMRPVRQLGESGLVAGSTELIGSLEQAYMDIRCPDGGTCGSDSLLATHEESGPTAFLSAVASFTPWSDFNQSPRNMYQCQMAKQTMGTPMDSYPYRADTKLYRLHTPQKPVARTQGYEKYRVNEYPLGTNAVVAVLSYTGCAYARAAGRGRRRALVRIAGSAAELRPPTF
jgi:DNA-directed RNA polymerase I subunit RPA2